MVNNNNRHTASFVCADPEPVFQFLFLLSKLGNAHNANPLRLARANEIKMMSLFFHAHIALCELP